MDFQREGHQAEPQHQSDGIHDGNDDKNLLERQTAVLHQSGAALGHDHLRQNTCKDHHAAEDRDAMLGHKIQNQTARHQGDHAGAGSLDHTTDHKEHKAFRHTLNRNTTDRHTEADGHTDVAGKLSHQKSHRNGANHGNPAGRGVQIAVGAFRNVEEVHDGVLHGHELEVAESDDDGDKDHRTDHRNYPGIAVLRLCCSLNFFAHGVPPPPSDQVME